MSFYIGVELKQGFELCIQNKKYKHKKQTYSNLKI